MGVKKSFFTCRLILSLLLPSLLMLACGRKKSDEFPGYSSVMLPGAEIISYAQFKGYLDSGRLAPYQEEGEFSGASGSEGSASGSSFGSSSIDPSLWVAGAALGKGVIVLHDYLAEHPEAAPIADPDNEPREVIEALDAQGEVQKFPVADQSYKILSLAYTIEQEKSQKTVDESGLVSRALIRPRYSAATQALLQATSGTPSSSFLLPTVYCPKDEQGHGVGSDEGSLDGTLRLPAQIYSDGLLSNFNWPAKPFSSCVKFQGIRGSCTAFSMTSALEQLVQMKFNADVNLSEQELYFRGKGFWDPLGSRLDNFAGSIFLERLKPSDAPKVVFESQWDYNFSPSRRSARDFSGSCSAKYQGFCSNSAGQGKLYCTHDENRPIQCGYLNQLQSNSKGVKLVSGRSFLSLSKKDESLNQAMSLLQQGIPVIVEATLTSSFTSAYHGYVNEPTAQDRTVGGHSMLMVGYVSQADLQRVLPSRVVNGNGGYFIIKNSWGTALGESGYFYVSYNYLKKYAYALIAIEDVSWVN
ncbi:MAG: C1 family peptidase [Bdellovibrionia bacterium]